jgi:hypothetical protein
MTGDWNVCQVRGCGAWWPYKSERVVLGRFRIVGYREVLWLGTKGSGESERGPGGALMEKGDEG